MPVLPRVVFAAAAVVAMGGITGCAKFDAALGQQQAIVSFKSGATIAQRLAVRTACGKLPAVSMQALPDLKKYPYALEELTFEVNRASDSQIASLTKCVDSFSSVAGLTLQDSSDDS